MRNTIEALILGVMIAVVVWPGGAPADGAADRDGEETRSLNVGLDIQVDDDWISLNGTWSTNRRDTSGRIEAAGQKHKIRIGAFPNVVQRAREGIVLFRALRTTTVCVAKLWIGDRSIHNGHTKGN